MPSALVLHAAPALAESLTRWLESHRALLEGFELIAPQEVLGAIRRRPALQDLEVSASPPLRDGGDLVLASRILSGAISGVLSFQRPDPGELAHHEAVSLVRAALLRQIPLALNEASATAIVRGLARSRIGYLIFNPVAGQGNPEQELAQIRGFLEPQLMVRVVMTRPDVDPADQARDLVREIQAIEADQAHESESMLIASGGDGTVGAVAGALLDTGIPLGIVPRGTANAFSVALGIPTALRAACTNLLIGNTRRVDAALCNGNPMILLAGLGFEAGMVSKASREMKNVLGPLAYILAGAQQFGAQRSFRASLELNGETQELEAMAITVANVAPATSVMAQGFGTVVPDDGLLDVIVATPSGTLEGLQVLSSLAGSALGRVPATHENLLSLRTDALRIRIDPAQELVVDGEMLEASSVEFRSLPGALTVVAPLQQALP
ncbi:lipid kinase [Synechococcus sp. RSCCF101]|uniref:diacylglycerol kinase family protein n=1 Tax=Synechococcus sp. RSCCF101 TaxID=2511069 RepID=UPI0012473886|nr:diacylglycerol kinase family protein [Synechococcus sp. RSCCF101]QEY31050.1 lipid kinase [Synechococcus sp. RSCCF101]